MSGHGTQLGLKHQMGHWGMVHNATVVIRWADQQPVKWKNGGGVTREMTASATNVDAATFDWRVSIADVDEPGPFSIFPGTDRVITLIEGASMVLHGRTDAGATETQILVPHQPFAFSGDEAMTCHLPDGPTRALNLITRRGRVSGEVTVHQAGAPLNVGDDAGLHLVVALGDSVAAVGDSGETWTLHCYDLLDARESVSLEAGPFAAIRID